MKASFNTEANFTAEADHMNGSVGCNVVCLMSAKYVKHLLENYIMWICEVKKMKGNDCWCKSLQTI